MQEKMTTINKIIAEIKTLSGHTLNGDEGVHYGASDNNIKGVTVCWMATPSAIEAAGKAGHDLILCHESLFFPYGVVDSSIGSTIGKVPEGWENWKTNKQRRELLEKYNLSCLRIHGSADEICIFDEFAECLGLGEPVYSNGYVKTFDIDPCTLGELVEHVKKRMKMRAIRVAEVTDMHQTVSKVGLPWGGLGLFVNVDYQQSLVEQECDVFIAGESDNYGFRFAQESGIPMIETSHEISENPGFEKFTSILAKAFPDIVFCFYENKCVWNIY